MMLYSKMYSKGEKGVMKQQFTLSRRNGIWYYFAYDKQGKLDNVQR
jgi:hypothetical protein